jgi:lysophospholipase L1-like esterase
MNANPPCASSGARRALAVALISGARLVSGCGGGGATPGADGDASVNAADGPLPNGSSGATSGSGAASSSGSATTSASNGLGGSGSGGASGSGSARGSSGGDAGNLEGGADASPVDAGGGVDTSKKITVWLAGDSTMQPCASPCPCGWGSQFQPLFNGNATIVDNGTGGRSIQTWLYEPNVTTTMTNGECVVSPMTYSARWKAMLDPTTGMKPGDYLFIEFGINDTDATCPRHVGTALFQMLLGTMAQAAQDRGAQPIFLTSTNAIICSGSTCPANRAFGAQTKAAGLADTVPVIDLTQLTADFYTRLGLCPNDGNTMSTTTLLGRFFCNDHTHFEAYGAGQVATVVAKALRDQNIGLAAYLK